MPGTGLRAPFNANSPINSYWLLSSFPSWPLASRMPRAMGRSNRPPSLGRSAGARLTVMRRWGNSKPLLTSAERTRSRLSRTAVSPMPTMVKAGSPGARWVSTRTSRAWMPTGERLYSNACVTLPRRIQGVRGSVRGGGRGTCARLAAADVGNRTFVGVMRAWRLRKNTGRQASVVFSSSATCFSSASSFSRVRINTCC